MACDLPRETKISFFGTFTIFFSIRGARKAGTPIHWAEFIHMLGSFLLFRRCGRGGLERKSICVRSRRDVWRHPLRPKRYCLNVIRPGPSMPIDRSLLQSLRGFSTAPLAFSPEENKLDLGDAGPVITYALRPYPSAGAAYELELYLAVDKCEGLAEDCIITTPAGMRWCRSRLRGISSRHC